MLYIELFLGVKGILTEFTIGYNIKSKNDRVQYAIDHWDNDKSVLPERINHVKTFKNIVGIGCIKCGSTYFHSLLLRNTRHWEMNNFDSKYHFVFKWDESHYFEQCTNCTFSAYLNALIQSGRHDPLQYSPKNKLWIFGEKTVTYFDHYNTAHLLSFYGHRYDIYFYIVLRNPIKQLWSHLWMRTEGCSFQHIRLQCLFIRNENYYLKRNDIKDVRLMAEYLNNFLLIQVEKELPIFYEIMNELYIDKNINNGNNKDINVNKIIELLIQRTSDLLHYYSHVFVQSCHYVLILLWYYEWNLMNEYKNIKFENRFRIIQIEAVFDNQKMGDKYVKRLMCWMIGYEMNLEECYKQKMIKNKERIHRKDDSMVRQFRKYAPDIVDVLDLNVSNTIKAFYNDSMQRLIWFINKHPQVMLGNIEFIPYW